MAYQMISAEKAGGFPVSVACGLLGVSRSAYYEWERGAPSDRALTDAWLLEQIKQIHAEHRGVYGWRRIHAELRLGHGVRVSGKRVRRLMRAAGISGGGAAQAWAHHDPGPRRPRRGRPRRAAVPAHGSERALGGRHHLPAHPGGLALPRRCARRYSRAIIGWSMADHMRAELVIDALQRPSLAAVPRPG